MISLMHSIKAHSTLTSLNISRNNLRPELSSSIVEICQGTVGLTSLDTSFNEMGGSPHAYDLAVLNQFLDAMGKNKTITTLNLAGNFLRMEGCKRVAEWVSHGGIGVEGYYLTGEVKILTRSTPFCLVTKLNLGNNCLDFGKEMPFSTQGDTQ